MRSVTDILDLAVGLGLVCCGILNVIMHFGGEIGCSWHVVHEMNRMRCFDERVARIWISQDLESSRKRSGRATNSLEDHP